MKYIRVYTPGKKAWKGYIADNPFTVMKNLDLDLHRQKVIIATISSLNDLKPCSCSGECPFKYTICRC